MVAASNRSVAYSMTPDRPSGCSVSDSVRSNLAVVVSRSSRVRLQPGQRQLDLGDVLQREHHLDERIAAHVAFGAQLLDQLLERQLLVRIGIERRFADPGEQIAKARVAGEVATQHQGIDEEADQALELALRASGDRAADGDVVLSAVAGQQHLEGRQQGHVERHPFALAQLLEGGGEAGRQRQGVAGAAVALHRGPWVIGGQLQRGQVGELGAPVGELALQDGTLQSLSLPQRIVRVLNG